MKNALVQARVTPKLKSDTEQIFKSIGLDTASAIRIFLQRVQREKDFPFDVRMYNNATIKTIQKSQNNKNLSKPYKDVHLMMQDILGKDYA